MRVIAAIVVAFLLAGCGGAPEPARPRRGRRPAVKLPPPLTPEASPEPSADAPPPPAVVEAPVADGAALYATHCAACHGSDGAGNGPAAAYIYPKPRNFTSGKYKIRTSASGGLPFDSDIDGVIVRGMAGTAMPPFAFLKPEERQAIIAHLKDFAVIEQEGRKVRLWDIREKPREIVPGIQPPVTPEQVALGKQAYTRMKCAACHGVLGRADGAIAGTQRDDWGYPIIPNDFTRGIYKGGGTDRDIYLRFTTGMNGAPMPSFGESLSDTERWALVAYVRTLAGAKKIPKLTEGPLVAAKAALPATPFDPAWDKVAPATLPLMALWQRKESPETVDVRALHDGTSLAILVEWPDSSIEGSSLLPQDFCDAAAVQFPRAGERAHLAMGERDRPVNIWHWRLDRQRDLKKLLDVEDLYPGMAVDLQPLADDPAFLTGRAAGNPSSAAVRASPVEDLNSSGFGTLKAQPAGDQNVAGIGAWNAGLWRVMFVRTLAGKGEGDAEFKVGTATEAAFAFWDGGTRDRNGQKHVTMWRSLELR